MTGRKTLLVDLDLRKPNIHTKLGLENGQGASNYLIGDCEEEEIIVHDTPFGFDFVRAGTIPPNPGELVHSDKLAETIARAREKYDYIVIDTSPIGLVPDAYAVIEHSDMCLFIIRCMQTNKSFCKQTLSQMTEVFNIAFRAADRRVVKPFHGPAEGGNEVGDLPQHALMHAPVPDHALLAHILLRGLELWLDQRNEPGVLPLQRTGRDPVDAPGEDELLSAVVHPIQDHPFATQELERQAAQALLQFLTLHLQIQVYSSVLS
jgi:hypothetical protein